MGLPMSNLREATENDGLETYVGRNGRKASSQNEHL